MKELFKKLAVRIQNPKIIVAVVSGVLLILANTGVITVEHAYHISDTLNVFLGSFVTLGVFGNPESHVTLNKQEIVQDIAQSIVQPIIQAIPQPVQAPVKPVQPVSAPQPVPVQPSVQIPAQIPVQAVQQPPQA